MAIAAALPCFETDLPSPGDFVEPIRFDARDLDPLTSPRVDLDAFVNARWRAANPVPPDRSCWDSFAILAERALQVQADIAAAAARSDAPAGSVERIVGDFWASAMDGADGVNLLEAELARIDALDTRPGIAAYVRDRHARGCGVVFRLDVDTDFADPEQTIAYVSQSGLGLPDRDDYFDTTADGIAGRQHYAAHIAALLELSATPSASAVAHAKEILNFETQLAEVSMSRQALARDIAARYRPVDTDRADQESPAFSWRAFFSAQGIEVPARFSLAMPDFHAKVQQLLRNAPLATWRAYLRYHTVNDAAPYLGEAFARQHHRFHAQALRGQKTMKPRWKRVLDAINAHAGEALGQLYVARCFRPQSRQQVGVLAEQLRAALRARLQNLEWMGDETRKAALHKLDALKIKIGYPDRWRDWSGLSTSRDSLYANVLAARAFEQRRQAQRIGKTPDRSLWPMAPQTINAGYDPQRNEIVFPAAILAPPFFDAAADPALNYGGIGAVIAHEMIHGYDDQGSRFGADGRFENWWADEDRARFDALAARLAAHIDALPARGGNGVDGRLTLGENIADFGGLAVACGALRNALAERNLPDPMIDGYTQAQRFFLGWAAIWRQNLTPDEARFRSRTDPHAPAGIRANTAPAHLADYATAFECKPGDPMWRDRVDRVQPW